jgi:sugar lactone lactonase YvrE
MSTTSKLSVSRNKGNGVVARIFFLDLGAGRILSANPDGSDLKTLVSEGRKLPDGLAVDVAAGHLYWTNMGNPKANDGTIFRSDLDGRNMTTIIAPGGTFTPKQVQIDKPNGKLYWSDREGMRVMRANLDGSDKVTLVPVRIQTSGAWASPSMRVPASFTGPRKVVTTQAKAASCERTSTYRGVKRRRTARTSNCSTTSCPSRSTSIWISAAGCSTGPTEETRPAATQ